MPDIKALTAAELLRLYRRRELSPVEVTRDQLDRIEKFEPMTNSFVIVDRDGAMAAAKASEARWQKGEPMGLVDGIGATVKDNIWMKGHPARRGSATSSTAPMNEDAPAVARLKENGAVILGKTTLPEFGWIGATHSPLTGITRNPWKLDRTPGGSSGGAVTSALLALLPPAFGLLGGREGPVRVDQHERVDGRLEPLDPVELVARDLDRGQFALAVAAQQLGGGQGFDVRHVDPAGGVFRGCIFCAEPLHTSAENAP